jgi:hypothetical protein
VQAVNDLIAQIKQLEEDDKSDKSAA